MESSAAQTSRWHAQCGMMHSVIWLVFECTVHKNGRFVAEPRSHSKWWYAKTSEVATARRDGAADLFRGRLRQSVHQAIRFPVVGWAALMRGWTAAALERHSRTHTVQFWLHDTMTLDRLSPSTRGGSAGRTTVCVFLGPVWTSLCGAWQSQGVVFPVLFDRVDVCGDRDTREPTRASGRTRVQFPAAPSALHASKPGWAC